MDERLARVEARLREIDEALERLCVRLDTLEHTSAEWRGADSDRVSTVTAGTRAVAAADNGSPVLPILTLIGRTFLVLGGAYLLRALTDTGTLSPATGVLIAFTYASTWIGAADRAAVRRPASGVFHGLASLLIACPLLLEASTRFGVLSAGAAAGLLAGLVAVAIGVAWHRDLQILAVIAAIAGSLTAIVLSITTRQAIPFALVAIVAAASCEAARAYRGWAWPGRITALATVLLVLEVVARAHAGVRQEPLAGALAIALILAALYVSVLTWSTIEQGPDASAVDVALWLVPIVVGLAGAFSIASIIGPVAVEWMGGTLFALGVAGYILSFLNEARWAARTRAVLTSLSCVVLAAGGIAALPGNTMDVLSGCLGLALVTAGVRTERPWLTLQGAALALVAVVGSGLLALVTDVWTGALPSSSFGWTAVLAFVIAVAGGLGLPLLMPHRTAISRAVSLVFTIVAALAGGALLILLIDSLDGRPRSPGLIAAERSAVLAALAVGLTALARLRPSAELKWLAYAAIALGGLKLAVEDMRVSSPLAIFFALAAYGAGLIASARLLARTR